MVDDGPRRIRLSRSKGWRLPAGAVNVARPSRWGNPFTVADYGRQSALERYEQYLETAIATGQLPIAELRGHDLACWCALDVSCHADILLKRANRR